MNFLAMIAKQAMNGKELEMLIKGAIAGALAYFGLSIVEDREESEI